MVECALDLAVDSVHGVLVGASAGVCWDSCPDCSDRGALFCLLSSCSRTHTRLPFTVRQWPLTWDLWNGNDNFSIAQSSDISLCSDSGSWYDSSGAAFEPGDDFTATPLNRGCPFMKSPRDSAAPTCTS